VGRRLILGTNILIAYERATINQTQFDDDELAVAAITIAEYRVGIELADTAQRAADRARALATITTTIDTLDYTDTTAAHHARLIAHTRKQGKPRGAHDLIIAAHALETDRLIVSRDAAAKFGDLPGITAITPQP
jgi:tRNA(fMet)-specific endonuclease VapC